MALIVTFTRVERIPGLLIPVEVADAARTEKIEIDSSSDGLEPSFGQLTAADGENVVSLYAEQACWVKVGKPDGAGNPTARPGEGRFLPAGDRMQLLVIPGSKVSATGIEGQ